MALTSRKKRPYGFLKHCLNRSKQAAICPGSWLSHRDRGDCDAAGTSRASHCISGAKADQVSGIPSEGSTPNMFQGNRKRKENKQGNERQMDVGNGLALHHVCSPIDKLARGKAAGKCSPNLASRLPGYLVGQPWS